MSQKCYKCKIIKPIECFCKDKYRTSGYARLCKECKNNYNRLYSKQNKTLLNKKSKDYYYNNKEKWVTRRENNRDYINAYNRQYQTKKYAANIQFKMKTILRSRLRNALLGCKGGSAIRDLGCSLDNLIIYLEQQFKSGITWENHGEWHIDHIVPLSKFDLTNRNDVLKACHYTNLQPLWAIENLQKGPR